jgi:alpha-tubulin suppressor-like RCC1 family protein
MAVACGDDFTIALTDNGDVWSWGEGEDGQLGLGTTGHQNKPAWVGGRDVFKEPVVLLAAGSTHAACVTSKGVLYTWGNGKHGELGDGFQEIRLNPQQINLATHGGEPAVMVSCGASHTVVLTEAGCVWTCGDGRYGKLGHGNDKLQLTLKLVSILEGSRPVRMSMVASGCHHNVALTSGGQVFTWGRAKFGSLGVTESSVVCSIYGESEIFTEDRFVPIQVARSSVETGECFGGAQPLMIAAGGSHTVVVMKESSPWVWGKGRSGQLGLGNRDNFYAPQSLPAQAFQGTQVLAAHCGYWNTIFLTGEKMWTCGYNGSHVLGHSMNTNFGLEPTCIEQIRFNNRRIIGAAIGVSHTVAVDHSGRVYSWGEAVSCVTEMQGDSTVVDKISLGALGHPDIHGDYVTYPIRLHGFGGTWVGSYQHALAFAMCTHARLGSQGNTPNSQNGKDSGCQWGKMSNDLVQKIMQACCAYPHGLIRLLGGDI